MRIWEWVLYGVAAVWAVKCLVTLMTQHALRRRYELQVELRQQLQQTPPPPADNATPTPTESKRRKAA